MSNHRSVELHIDPVDWQREHLKVTLRSKQSSGANPARLKLRPTTCGPGIFLITIPPIWPAPK
jgi:hypothetical protein